MSYFLRLGIGAGGLIDKQNLNGVIEDLIFVVGKPVLRSHRTVYHLINYESVIWLRVAYTNGNIPPREIVEHQFLRYLPSQCHLRRRDKYEPDEDS